MSKLTCFLGLHRWRIVSWWPNPPKPGYESEPITEQCARCGLKRAYKED